MIEAIKKYVDSGRPIEQDRFKRFGAHVDRIKLGNTGVTIFRECGIIEVCFKGDTLPGVYRELDWLFKSLKAQAIEALQ